MKKSLSVQVMELTAQVAKLESAAKSHARVIGYIANRS